MRALICANDIDNYLKHTQETTNKGTNITLVKKKKEKKKKNKEENIKKIIQEE